MACVSGSSEMTLYSHNIRIATTRTIKWLGVAGHERANARRDIKSGVEKFPRFSSTFAWTFFLFLLFAHYLT